MEVSQKVKIELPCDAAIPLLGIYLNKIKTLISQFSVFIIYNSQDMEAT